MDTIHPLDLATMMATHQPFALIDVRPRDQFECSHICGARSIPLNRLCPEKIRREHGNDDSGPVFLVCRRGIRASLAAGMLRPSGRLRPIIVAGGMELWEAQGLPTVHTLRMQMPPLMRQLLYAGRQRLAVLRVARKKVRKKSSGHFRGDPPITIGGAGVSFSRARRVAAEAMACGRSADGQLTRIVSLKRYPVLNKANAFALNGHEVIAST